MQTENETNEIDLDGWLFRVHNGSGSHPGKRLLVQLHGWTGDETVMWIFSRRMPPSTSILSPRAPFPAPEGGFSWIEKSRGVESRIEEYRLAVQGLLERIDAWDSPAEVQKDRFDLLGFSQGAALAYAACLFHPDRVNRVAGLAGFLPQGAQNLVDQVGQQFTGNEFFIAHGTHDERVPVRYAREAVQFFQDHGAKVTYCESNVGHKLSVDCFRGLEEFFHQSSAPDQRDQS